MTINQSPNNIKAGLPYAPQFSTIFAPFDTLLHFKTKTWIFAPFHILVDHRNMYPTSTDVTINESPKNIQAGPGWLCCGGM